MTGAAAITASGWGWRHAGRRAWAVRDLTFSVEPGERVLLLGPSGSGKSTLLAGLAGVLGGEEDGESEGALLVGGAPAARSRGRAGLLLQDPESNLVMARVGDDVAFGCENLGIPPSEIWPRVRAALDEVGLDVPLDAATNRLSGGQKQRLALAGILAMRPGLLLLDEPTANLDPDGVTEVRDAVVRATDASGATLLVVEHRVAVWRDAVDRVLVLGADGTLLADGSPDRVLVDAAPQLRSAGVWLPGDTVAPPAPRTRGERLLDAGGLVASRPGGPSIPGPDLAVFRGDALALTGRNGAGKTTIALTLGGLLRPAAGEVRAAPALASEASAAPDDWSSRQLLRRVGTVFQNPEHQFLESTVQRELELGPRALGQKEAEYRPRVAAVLERLGLAALGRANPFTLSGGQKRRLSVATALVAGAPLLVLDEPTFGQDATTWRELVALMLEQLDAGNAVIAATHDGDFVRAIGATAHIVQGLTPTVSGEAAA